MPTQIATAESLVQKLQTFHTQLAPAEKEALEKLLQTTATSFASVSNQPFATQPVPEISRLNDLLRDAQNRMGPGGPVAATWTTVTITTTVASHPRIGC